MEQTTKFCKKCRNYLDLIQFHKTKSKSYPDGRITTCKTCLKNNSIINKDKNKTTLKIDRGQFIVSFE